eukprot:13621413-Alexandrium_andersonii.AAC.1
MGGHGVGCLAGWSRRSRQRRPRTSWAFSFVTSLSAPKGAREHVGEGVVLDKEWKKVLLRVEPISLGCCYSRSGKPWGYLISG